MEQLINKFYIDLVETLPFTDPIFRARLKTAGLFLGDLKETTESKPSSAAMTSHFLDHGINNNENNFLSLVRVMEECDFEPVNNLANKIKKEIEQWHSKPGNLSTSSDGSHDGKSSMKDSKGIPPAISDLGEYYRNSYKAKRNNPVIPNWPPNQRKLNVSVTLFHYKSGRTQEELIEIAKRHEEGAFAIDDMASSEPEAKRPRLGKVTKCLNDIFAADPAEQSDNGSPPQYVLIEGAPGIGKTMLAKEIAFCWANGELLNKVTVLFLLLLRDPKLWEVRTVKQLVKILTFDGALVDINIKECTRILLHSEHFQIGFVFDGFDEYPHDKNPFIFNLITDRIFPKAVVVCTSRPAASLYLHDQVDRRIEILGFTKEDRDRYITKSLTDSPDKDSKLQKYLKDNPIIDDLCFIPLHLAILMYLFKQDTLPENLTELNKLFAIHTIYRSMNKTRGQSTSNISSELRNLPTKDYNVICKLCKLAYEGVTSHQLVFASDEIMQKCPEISDVPDAVNGFGLLEAVPHYCTIEAGTTTSYSFLHFTMQEFLAAYHVSTLPSDEQLSLLQQTFWNAFFQYMWIMYVGIVGVNSEPFSRFIHCDITYSYIERNTIRCLHLFQCYTEAKRTEMPSVISLFEDGDISFHDVSFFPRNFLSIISFLSKSNIRCKALQFNHCYVVGRDLMNMLKQFVINNMDRLSTLEYINLCYNVSGSSPWVVFCAVIKHCLVTNLTLLGSGYSSGIELYAKELMDSLQQNTTLKSLTLCSIEINELEVIKNVLVKTKCSVNKLNISTRQISLEEISLKNKNVVISTAVHCSSEAEDRIMTINVLFDKETTSTTNSLELSGLRLTDYEVGCVAFGLQDNLTVKSVNISHNHITNSVIRYIEDCLLNNRSITELNISHNEISSISINKIILVDSTLMNLDTAIAVNNTLKELNMSCCLLGCAGAGLIAQALSKNLSLQKLDFSANEISDDGAIAVCKCLINNSSLQDLNISFNKITDSGAEEMANTISNGTKFSKLNISGNRITSEGLIIFLRVIQSNSALKTLFVQLNNVTKSGLFEIQNCIKRLNISLEIHASWNDIDTDHQVTAIVTSYYYFNIYSEIADTTGDGLKWSLAPLQDTNYASELLSSCLQENSSLKELYLRYCVRITSEGAKKIAEALKVNKTLVKLNISNQFIGDDGAIAIGESLKVNITLQDLSMAGISLSPEGIKKFMNAIKVNTGLQKLDLSDFLLPSLDAINAISDYLRDNTSLQELNLSSSNTTIGLDEMMQGLHTNTTLQKLILSKSYFDHMGTAICNLLKHNETLLELNVSKCIIRKTELKEITEGLKLNKTLQNLDISCNSLYDDEMTFFCECFQTNCTLKKLNLSGNHMYTVKIVGTEIVQLSQSLQHLNISKNRISYESLETISKYLCNNNTLLKLDMSVCGITSDGAKLIAEVIKVNTTLKKLDISHNQVHDVGIMNIADSLKNNKIIQKLNLSSTCMSSSGAAQIAEALYVNKTLQKLDISHNTLENEGVSTISECLKNNFTLQKLDVSYSNITTLTVNMFAEAIKVNEGLYALDLSGNEIFDDTFKFNMTVLDAMPFNKSIINLGLPVDYKHAAEMRDKLEAVNKERARQGVNALYTSADEEYILDYHRKMQTDFVKLSYL